MSVKSNISEHFRTVELILYYSLAKPNIYDLPKTLQFAKQSMFKVIKRAETAKLRLVFLKNDQLKILRKPLLLKPGASKRKDGKFGYYHVRTN